MKNKTVLLVLIVLNVLVLLGQLVPDMAPPFARTVNIIFLVGSFCFSLRLCRVSKKVTTKKYQPRMTRISLIKFCGNSCHSWQNQLQ